MRFIQIVGGIWAAMGVVNMFMLPHDLMTAGIGWSVMFYIIPGLALVAIAGSKKSDVPPK